jgi:preprotein translocase subunit YajC
MLTTYALFAEDPPAADPGQGSGSAGGGLTGMLITFLPILLLLWLMIIRPAKKQEAQRKALLANTEKGDKILTTGGIIGYVVSVNEDELTVRIDDNVKVKLVKSGIAQNLTKLELLNQPQQTQTAEKK